MAVHISQVIGEVFQELLSLTENRIIREYTGDDPDELSAKLAEAPKRITDGSVLESIEQAEKRLRDGKYILATYAKEWAEAENGKHCVDRIRENFELNERIVAIVAKAKREKEGE